MTRYGGTKALDAEIKIDFTKNTIFMDYSSVKGMARIESNSAIVLEDEFKKLSKWERFKYALWLLAIVLPRSFFVFPVYSVAFVSLVNRGVIKSAEWQYNYQVFLQYIYTSLHGTIERVIEGEQFSKKLIVGMPNNLYFEYDLTGEYKEKIQSISVVRRYVTYKRFGVFKKTVQCGWDLVFEFIEPPKSGSCRVEFIDF
jgi:hypothetical protein